MPKTPEEEWESWHRESEDPEHLAEIAVIFLAKRVKPC